MNIHRLLAGILAIVLVMGISTPAYAAEPRSIGTGEQIVDPSVFFPSTVPNPEDIVFENGEPDLNNGWFVDSQFVAEDFELEEDAAIADFHFIVIDTFFEDEFDEPIEYFILEDDEGEPTNNVISSGDATNVEVEQIEDGPFGTSFLVWFDFEEPIPLSKDVRYWVGVHVTDSFDGRYGLAMSTDDFGDASWLCSLAIPPCDLFPGFEFGSWFQITAKDVIVGGELLPIDSTALLVAGAQTNAVWIMSALAVIGSIAFGALYLTSKKN